MNWSAPRLATPPKNISERRGPLVRGKPAPMRQRRLASSRTTAITAKMAAAIDHFEGGGMRAANTPNIAVTIAYSGVAFASAAAIQLNCRSRTFSRIVSRSFVSMIDEIYSKKYALRVQDFLCRASDAWC